MIIRWQQHLAIRTLKAGGVIAYPTESVFGLGCVASNLSAVSQILAIKERSFSKGLILLVSKIEQAEHLIEPLNLSAVKTINQKRPRATTWLVNKRKGVSELLSGVHNKLAIRVTQFPIAKQLCEQLGAPIISTSCNLAGKPTSTKDCILRNRFQSRVDYFVSGSCGGQKASELIDLETKKVLRR